MSISDIESRQVLDKLSLYAETQLKSHRLALFKKFLNVFLGHMPTSDLLSRTVADLYGSVSSQWELMMERSPGQVSIKIFNPDFKHNGWESTHTIVQVIMDDMPFIIDTLRMELYRLGLTTHLTIHSGGIKVVRDEKHQMQDLFLFHESVEQDFCLEAPVQIEIDRHNSPKVLKEIKNHLLRVLSDVRLAVGDWKLMCQQMQQCILEMNPSSADPDNADYITEARQFLEWILNDHFTFLGYRYYEIVGQGEERALRLVEESSLGVLRNCTKSKMMRHYSELSEKAHELALCQKERLIFSKTNTIATVHRPVYTDYIGIKRFNESGELVGESRFIGLYTSDAYAMDPRSIPLIRKKVNTVIESSTLSISSHAGKDLLHIISTLPRDDLFHASTEELSTICSGILQMQERRLTKLFIREDIYGRFVSCLLYLPRENFNTGHAFEIEALFRKVFKSKDITHDMFISESVLARLSFVIKLDPKVCVDYDVRKLESAVKDIVRSWEDELHNEILDYFGEERGTKLISRYRHAFPAGYREAFDPRFALTDIEHIESLKSNGELGMSIYRPLGAPHDLVRFKLYRLDQTVPLSDAVPMLENMGLRVVGEQPYSIHFANGQRVWINDFSMHYPQDSSFEIDEVRDIFQEAFQRIWMEDAENDSFNELILAAQMSWREVSVLRAYTKYFRQMGFAFTEKYTATTLIKNCNIARLLVEYFKLRFDPKSNVRNHAKFKKHIREIEKALDQVATLDEDRTLRRYLLLIDATLRTNYFQMADSGACKSYLSFKLNPKMIPELPLPLPACEIYVYSPRFEGVHLRAAKVARGGIRWSDRLDDYRTEVLGLMKAQQVKNALIVPAGAKGGFVTKKLLPDTGSRDKILQEGIACYEKFICGLLDVTDDIREGVVKHRSHTVCYDEEDPYLVVAADKGTATFSDIANSISEARGYWLGDAFASGGSTGYDHKKMGITARGAWVSAERHFQNLGINVNESEITVVGIGDMSGDVFGNGLLMSPHLKLVAAFNHINIFLDPNPDPEKSFVERKRLFNLPRSSWEDYNRSLISEGGGIYSRAAKSIALSPQVRQLLKTDAEHLVPHELIKAILKSPVDLIWNGGIGTYVKAACETNLNVGDRSNDAVRIDGKDLNARVVCEGGNLGLTQLGRMEYELAGGHVNTDFIDNSAGVDCSDHEVNIKILLNTVVAKGNLTLKQRNELLAQMSDEVASLVLRNNYEQNRVISLSSFYAYSSVDLILRTVHALEKAGKLDRHLEFLPEDKIILERRSLGKGLTRPGIAVLLSYSKNVFRDKIVKTDLVKDPWLSKRVKNAFPAVLHERFKEAMDSHYLADEIIATQITNQMFADMGMTFVNQLQDETSASVEAIVRAYAVSREIFQLESYNQSIRSLDYQVSPDLQYEMMQEGVRLVRRGARWFLRNRRKITDISDNINEFKTHVENIAERLPKLLLGVSKERFDNRIAALVEQKVPETIAIQVASSPRIYHALNIVEAALVDQADVFRVAKIYFMLVDRLDLLWFRDQINHYPAGNHWSILAKAACKGDLDWVQRALTVEVLQEEARSIPGKVSDWFDRRAEAIERWNNVIADLKGKTDTPEFPLLFVAIRELMDLCRETAQ